MYPSGLGIVLWWRDKMEVKDKHLPSDQWCDILGINPDDTLDGDGWDRANWDYSFYEHSITRKEFVTKLMYSTCRLTDEILKVCKEG